MRISKFRAVLGAAIAFWTVSSAFVARATTYDIGADFSLASNPNGVWTYGYESSLGSTLILYQSSSNSSELEAWGVAPADWYNSTSNPIGTSGTVITPPHTAAFHPGSAGQYSVYRFTAPTSEIYQLSSSFFSIDTVPGGTDVHVLDNGTQLFGANVSSSSATNFDTYLILSAGEMVDFAVGYGIDGNFYNNSTGIVATLTSGVTPAPEPSTFALVAMACAAFALIKRAKTTLT